MFKGLQSMIFGARFTGLRFDEDRVLRIPSCKILVPSRRGRLTPLTFTPAISLCRAHPVNLRRLLELDLRRVFAAQHDDRRRCTTSVGGKWSTNLHSLFGS
jgi:hypothetical protein